MSHPKGFFERIPTITTPEQMFMRLRDRVMAVVRVEALAPLEWWKIDAFTLHSACGRYAVFKTKVLGKPVYSAGRRTGLGGLIAADLQTAEEAKKIAQAYADSLVSQARNVPR